MDWVRTPISEVIDTSTSSIKAIVSRVTVKEVPGLAEKHGAPDDQLDRIQVQHTFVDFNTPTLSNC